MHVKKLYKKMKISVVFLYAIMRVTYGCSNGYNRRLLAITAKHNRLGQLLVFNNCNRNCLVS
jgi:hypothetical protein